MSKPIFKKPEMHSKGWGYELWLCNTDKYCGKILHIENSKSLSFHFHKQKDEHFYILIGTLRFEYYNLENADLITEIVNQGDVIHIPAGTPHKLTALVSSDIIEISTQHFDEDSYRIGKGDGQQNAIT